MPEKETKKSSDSNLWAVVAYFFGALGGILLYFLKKEDKYVRFHAMQSILFSIVMYVLTMVTFGIAGIVFLLGWIFLMWKAWSGEMYKLPVLGEYAEKFSAS